MNTSQELIRVTLAPRPQQPVTNDDFRKPWPEYTRLFRDRPERAASVARELFSSGDLRFLPFILSFPWEKDQLRLYDVLHSSDFLLASLDFVSNESWYAQLREIVGLGHAVKESCTAVCSYWL